MAGKDFFDVKRSAAKTSEGDIELPMLFYDVGVRYLNFWVDYEKTASKLAGTGLLPCRFFNGKTIVSLVYFQYRSVDIGPYDEVTITIVVHPEILKKPLFYLPAFLSKTGMEKNNIGAYVLEMPVTTPAARTAGREIWGYPKFVTKISSRLDSDSFEFSVFDPKTNESILSVKCKTGAGIRVNGFDLATYSNLNDSILKTIVNIDAKYRLSSIKNFELVAGHSDHRMVRNIRDLELDRIKPFMVMGTDSFRSRLNRGEPVAKWKTPPLPYEEV
ncbi:MAG: hypothetical protein EHM85_00380 [Desulfobacteraceae bacterium]|nr:MAG: hypothetical protein EHM85_00380 [Desulfobacteraceae bacterium]